MGMNVTKSKFDYSYTDEPHATRRKEILKKYPEIKELFGVDESFKYVVLAQVLTQLLVCYLIKDSDWLLVCLMTYFVSGTFNHSLTLAVHEISHNAAFGTHRPFANRMFGLIANIPLAVPMSVSFKKYHLEHHRYLGEECLDTDVPTELEARFFKNAGLKLIWVFLQPVFYAFRPMIIYKKALYDLEILNFATQLSFDFLVLYYWGPKALFYFFMGLFIGSGLHPLAAHFISDHYVFREGQETYSYYGPINLVTYNVGHHYEHHDFPFISGKYLPLVREIASEFYEPLEVHESWVYLMYDFIFNAKWGLRSRVKRPLRGQLKFYGDGINEKSVLYEYVAGLLGYMGVLLGGGKAVE